MSEVSGKNPSKKEALKNLINKLHEGKKEVIVRHE